MECATGVLTAPMGAGWRWDTLADSASSHHIPSLAPAVALPAPRHDRRRTGAAGSPPGGFPFVELTPRRHKLQREATTSCPGAKRDPGPRDVICGPDPRNGATRASRGDLRRDERRRESRGTASIL